MRRRSNIQGTSVLNRLSKNISDFKDLFVEREEDQLYQGKTNEVV